MAKKFLRHALCMAIGTLGFVSLGFCSGTATLSNAGFDTFIAATDSFPGWKIDTSGKSMFIITQATDSVHSGTGCLKMQIKDPADTITAVRITGAITGLLPNAAFTITAWVKYANMPAYYNAMFGLQQATLTSGTWVWTDRPWLTPWGNDPGTSDWKQITGVGTTADSANVFNLVISLSKGGPLWVDDIAITYESSSIGDIHMQTTKHDGIYHNRISFSHAMAYSLEACSLDGQTIARKTGIASSLDLNKCDITNGIYLMKVKTSQRTYTSRIVVSR